MSLEKIIQESFEEYRAKSKENLSSHQLADFRKCPALYLKKKMGLIDDEDRPAFQIGRAVHTMVLEGGDVFERTYAIGGPINPRTGKSFGPTSQAYQEWAAQQGKPVLAQEQFELTALISASVRNHTEARKLLADGIPEGVIRCEFQGLPCQTRMDFFNPEAGLIDLKTCDDLNYFEAEARRFGYTYQLAFYRAILRQVTGRNYPVHLIAVEKKEPFRCGVWLISETSLNACEIENTSAIERLKECQATHIWPTGYETPRTFEQ